MPSSSIKLEAIEFKPWNSPHLLTNQFKLLAKFLLILNAHVPPEKEDINIKVLKDLELLAFSVFSHQMMLSWFALAKSYYPFYQISAHEQRLINELEKQLGIKVTDYDSLSALINELFLSKYPNVNSQYQLLIDNIKKVMAKLTAVALSTPALLNDANQRDRKRFEEAGPSMANCINPIETILRHIMNREEMDSSVIISATSLLLQVKAIKFHFEQISLLQQLENMDKENKLLQTWQSKEEQLALIKVYKLQKRVNQYCKHLTDSLHQLPNDEKVSAKLASITLIKNELDKEPVLPSQRIELFEKQLNDVTEQLQEHRDPLWIRFLRDCLRILAFTFLGVAIYRTLSGQPVNFFKPSHGQIFVEEANCIMATEQEMFLPR